MKVLRVFGFFTIISLLLHILSYTNLIGSTLPLALFVFIGALFLFWIYPGYYFLYWNKGLLFISFLLVADILLHYVPLYVLYKKYERTDKDKRKIAYFEILVVSFLYLIFMNTKIITIYKDPIKYLIY